MAVIITPIRSATGGTTMWAVGLEGRTQFIRKTSECVCDVVDALTAKHPDAVVYFTLS